MIPIKVLQSEPIHITVLEPKPIPFSLSSVIVQRIGDYDPYEGDYVVTPKASTATVLPTKDKAMTDDVTVLKIPYFETSNENGTTVYIAEV